MILSRIIRSTLSSYSSEKIWQHSKQLSRQISLVSRLSTKNNNRTTSSMKYILVTGGVISGVGKGVIASSFGTILNSCGIAVTSLKIDPYINIDAGTFSPFEHGEFWEKKIVFICGVVWGYVREGRERATSINHQLSCVVIPCRVLTHISYISPHSFVAKLRWSLCAGRWWRGRSRPGQLRAIYGRETFAR